MVSSINRKHVRISADSREHKDGDGLSSVYTGVHAALVKEKILTLQKYLLEKRTLKAGTYWGLSFSFLTVILHTASAQTLIYLISKPTVELNRFFFSTTSVL